MPLDQSTSAATGPEWPAGGNPPKIEAVPIPASTADSLPFDPFGEKS